MSNGHFDYGRLEKQSVFISGTFTVMFVDIVRFTKFGDNQALKRAVRTLRDAITDVFEELRWDVFSPVTKNDAIMLPTGDGYGIGFETSVNDTDVLSYAAELSTRLKQDGAPVRTGISKGPSLVYKDVNDKMNLVGWGIIDAQRAMSCGSKNHILCTEGFAAPYLDSKDDPNLHKIGRYTAKARRLVLYNYYGKGFGNKSIPSKKKRD